MRGLLRSTVVALVAGAVLGSGAVGLVPTSAWATAGAAGSSGTVTAAGSGSVSSPSCAASIFTAAQQRVEQALAGRVTQLGALSALVESSHLTPSDESTLQHDITDVELPGIEALQPQAQQATTCAGLRQVAQAMVFDYRVYVVMTPQTHETVVADRESEITAKLTALEPTVQDAIDWARQRGKDVTEAESELADMQARLSSATSTLSGLSATLLAQTPAGYPGNAAVFLTGRTDETNARNDLRSAYEDLATIARSLGVRAEGAGSATTTTS